MKDALLIVHPPFLRSGNAYARGRGLALRAQPSLALNVISRCCGMLRTGVFTKTASHPFKLRLFLPPLVKVLLGIYKKSGT